MARTGKCDRISASARVEWRDQERCSEEAYEGDGIPMPLSFSVGEKVMDGLDSQPVTATMAAVRRVRPDLKWRRPAWSSSVLEVSL